MSGQGWLQIVLFLGVVLVLVRPLGAYMARVFEGAPIFGMDRALRPVERLIYKLGGIDPESEMTWKRYAANVLVFSLVGFLLLYLLQRVQGWLPGGPEGMGNVQPDLAFNTAVSFVTNTNWQAYGGETTMKYVTQMLGMTVQNFVSAGTGHSGGDRPHPRLLPPLHRPAGQLLGGSDPRRPLRVAASLLRLRHRAGVSGSRADAGAGAGGATGAVVRGRGRRDGHRRRPSRSVRWPRSSPSSNWAPTAAASSTPTRRIRSRTPRPSPTSCSW